MSNRKYTDEFKSEAVKQNTAIDDATRIRALKIYQRHNQENTIEFVDYVIQ